MAQAQFRQRGETIDHKPAGSLALGDVVVLGDIIGVASTAITANTTGALQVSGTFKMVKDASTIAAGNRLYWNATGDPVGGVAGSGALTTNAAGAIFAGFAIAAAATGDASVEILLADSQRKPRVATSTVAATGSTNADAAALKEGFNLVTGGDGTKGVVLPAIAAGVQVIVKNSSGSNLKLYPGTGKKINGGTATTGALTLAANTIAILTAYDTTDWFSQPLLPS